MAKFNVYWKESDQTVKVLSSGEVAPEGYTLKGAFDHADTLDQVGSWEHGHVLYHHVQDILYRKIGWTNMQMVKIHTS